MGKFEPMRLVPAPQAELQSLTKLCASCTLKGDIADEFEKMREEYGLSRAHLMRQMVYHCLGRSEELKDFYKRLAILGE